MEMALAMDERTRRGRKSARRPRHLRARPSEATILAEAVRIAQGGGADLETLPARRRPGMGASRDRRAARGVAGGGGGAPLPRRVGAGRARVARAPRRDCGGRARGDGALRRRADRGPPVLPPPPRPVALRRRRRARRRGGRVRAGPRAARGPPRALDRGRGLRGHRAGGGVARRQRADSRRRRRPCPSLAAVPPRDRRRARYGARGASSCERAWPGGPLRRGRRR